jgi:hypothetical protein
MTWHECSEQVLGFKNAIYKKYSNYDHAVSDFNASCRAVIAPPKLLQPNTCASHPDLDGKRGSWKNVAIVILHSFNCGIWPMVEAVHVQQM